ncbi:cell division protein FtsA [Gracilibacillus timonensis]|uniref:cell division protein FtsA n=1 Tax=Gracilibacillus timonensis TaxID=1816696 RepID=UPI000823FE19|nr:cell division protein FtsA [Gracilibacillus timonensis]
MNKPIFALDIGTRSVIGLLMEKIEDKYHLIDYYMLEHHERSMLDGQIHDVVSVADIIGQVKQHLEDRHQIKLEQACVAAAGRALKTKRVTSVTSISKQPIINTDDILLLELEAVQQAQYQLANGEEETSQHYYCVGYSVLRYKLDNEEIGSLIDQQGEAAEVEIIATFLPKVVVESLLSALQRADLRLEALTLEPIAAIQVLIPPSMRRLNVALVDIGAGTSDIALTSEGTVTAYGMVPKAGDEITEALSDHYLLDFHQAEQCKRELTIHNQATIEDILGFAQEITLEETLEHILPAVEQLAHDISQEIITLNGGKAPKAVMLVGGGSQTPALSRVLANRLQLPENRVAIREVQAIPSLTKQNDLPVGPDFVTPIGIAIAAKQNPVHYISVMVNNRTIRLFEMKNLTVADGLLTAGLQIKKLYGKPGLAAIIEYNGKQITLPGGFGKPPLIYINDQAANIDDSITNGDKIDIIQGEDGEQAEMTLQELIGEPKPITIFYQEEPYSIAGITKVNGREVPADYLLQDGDIVLYQATITLEHFLDDFSIQRDPFSTFTVWIDNQEQKFAKYVSPMLLNGAQVQPYSTLKDGDILEAKPLSTPCLSDILVDLEISYLVELKIIYNQRPLTLSQELVKVYRDGEQLRLHEAIRDQDRLQIQQQKQKSFIFQDIFRFISLDLTQATGKVELLRNGNPATFFEPLQPNDQIEIKLENR